MKYLNKTEKDFVKLNIITKETWKMHYTHFQYNSQLSTEDIEKIKNYETDEDVDPITLVELNDVLKVTTKSIGTDNINSELTKYRGLMLKLKTLHPLNMCWTFCHFSGKS